MVAGTSNFRDLSPARAARTNLILSYASTPPPPGLGAGWPAGEPANWGGATIGATAGIAGCVLEVAGMAGTVA